MRKVRLIDVNNFKKNNPEYLQLDIDYVTEVTVEDVLDDEPTVEAIPIEWIEKQMAEREDYGDFNTAAAIGYLLLSWEKENEIDRR